MPTDKTTGRILIVEDEEKIAGLLSDYLQADGFDTEILENGDEVISRVKASPPVLILLDIMLPGEDGVTVCRELRRFSKVPVIMITARVDEIDRVVGLEIGADDYICKPFSPREVVARVHAVLRRLAPAEEKLKLVWGAGGELVLDQDEHRVTANDTPLDLTRGEFDLLHTLMRRPGRAFNRAELLKNISGETYEGYERSIDTHVKNLRRKLAVQLPGQEIIKTVYGVGYKLRIGTE